MLSPGFAALHRGLLLFNRDAVEDVLVFYALTGEDGDMLPFQGEGVWDGVFPGRCPGLR